MVALPQYPPAAEAHYRAEAARLVMVMGLARSLWGEVSEADIIGSWLAIAARMAAVVSLAQAGASASGALYVPKVLTELGINADMIGAPNPAALVGVASDGRTLAGLLEQPALRAQSLVDRGGDARAALDQAGRAVDRIVQTQIQDAARVSAGVATIASPHATGYTRLLQVPSCSRCVLLAGRVYRAAVAFDRHPRCDCRHVPTDEATAGDLTLDPAAYFTALERGEIRDTAGNVVTAEQTFTTKGAEAIRDGADIGQVVNARRGGALYDTTGPGGQTLRATRAGARRNRVRLTPEAIYKVADGNRAEAVRLLHVHRYIT